MNNFLAPFKTSYKLCGYISDDSQYGFKTPVFKHEDECFIQNAKGDPFNERIESFIKMGLRGSVWANFESLSV